MTAGAATAEPRTEAPLAAARQWATPPALIHTRVSTQTERGERSVLGTIAPVISPSGSPSYRRLPKVTFGVAS